MNNDFPFNQEIFEETGFKGTNIDRDYPDLKVAFFFDGPHHKNLRQAQKDEIITRILKEKFGYHVRRWMFEKGNKGLARVIADEAKEFLDSVRQLKNFVAQKLVRSCRGCHKEIPEGFALCPNCYPNACYTKNITEKIAGASS